ncbi:MAG: hypothetical protein RQ754_02910 [Desulfuromonadales bacterium]|nr:hypothetical protein [Desulfuromonadales bacterium]
MRRICAWCKDVMGEKPGASEETHGICIPCLGKHFPGMEAAASGLFKQHDLVESAEISRAETSDMVFQA